MELKSGQLWQCVDPNDRARGRVFTLLAGVVTDGVPEVVAATGGNLLEGGWMWSGSIERFARSFKFAGQPAQRQHG